MFNTKHFYKVVIFIDIIFILLHFIAQNRGFNLDGENNLPTLYQAIKLVAVGGINLYGFVKVKHKSRFIGLILGGVFTFLGLDEWFQIHERLGENLRAWFASSLKFELNFAEWLIIYLPAMIFFLVFLYFVWKRLQLDVSTIKKQMNKLFLLGLICLAFVPITEFIGTWNWDFDSGYYGLIVAIEEGLELIGVSLFLGFSMRYWKKSSQE